MEEMPPSLAALRRQLMSQRRAKPRSPDTGAPEQERPYPGLFDVPAPPPDGPGSPATESEFFPPDRTPLSPPLPREGASGATARPAPTMAAEERGVPNPTPQTWTVSGLVRHVRGIVEQDFSRVSVEGEISNWRPAASGHCYFTVKDSGAQLSAVMFRRQSALLQFQPKDGDAVKLHGQLSLYESRGQMQLIVEWIQQAGLGALLAEVQRLKEKLRQEGIFDRKRPLPPFPHCIGVITSLHGAALRDIVKVCRRRHATVRLLIHPAAVQGPNCAGEIAAGLRWFSAHPDQADVVLVARGGGSWEDLHGFDDERVARAIAACSLPVITGIGHATDTTVADAAADVCAPTPSAAAELLTAAQHRIQGRLDALQNRLLRAGNFELLRARQRLSRLSARTVLGRVEDALDRRAQRIDELQLRAHSALNQNVRALSNRHRAAEGRLARHDPSTRIPESRRRLEALRNRLERAAGMHALGGRRRADTAATRLGALSPLRVLDRGYALVYGPDGRLLRHPDEAHAKERIRARLAQGTLEAEVLGR